MSTLLAVCVVEPLPADFFSRVAPLDIVPTRAELPPRSLFIDTFAWSPTRTTEVAEAVSRVVAGPVLGLLAQTTADVYQVTEFGAGRRLREIAYSRDGDGWGPSAGEARAWEADFHFALPEAQFVEDLGYAEWDEAEIERARAAYVARDLSLLPRLPDASSAQFYTFVEKLGLDPQAGFDAKYERPGFFRRLFRR